MNQEQFKAFWIQLKPSLKKEWKKIPEEDLLDIDGDLAKFTTVIEKRYGAAQKGGGEHVGEPTLFPLVRELR